MSKELAERLAKVVIDQGLRPTTITEFKGIAEAEGFIGVTREVAATARAYVQREYTSRAELDEEEKEKKPTIATVITNMALDADILFFRDNAQQAYAKMKIDDHWEIWPVRSTRFKEFLIQTYRMATGSVPNSNAVNDAKNALSAHAVQKGPVYSLYNRVAWYDKAIWYDLTNEKWEVVRIDENGWEILPETPRPMFRRFDHQMPQVYPVASNDKSPEQLMTRLMLLMPFHNHADEINHILDITCLVFCLVPEVPHPTSVVYGPAGSGKTKGFHATVKSLVDPSNTASAGLSVPGKISDFPLQFQRHYYLIYSNMSYISREQADIFCRAIDGAATETRRLYTDDDVVSFRYTRCLGINAIPLLGTQEDLMDRSILFPLGILARENRMDEEELQEKFEVVRPEILGAMFDTLSAAMKIKPTIELDYIERMGAYTKWGHAIAQALNYDPSAFHKAYATNRASANTEVIEADVVARTIMGFMENKDVWLGSPKQLFHELETYAFGEKEKRPRGWPKDEAVLGRKLARVAQNLERSGLIIEDSKKGGGVRVKTLSWHEGYGPETAQRTLDESFSMGKESEDSGGSGGKPLLSHSSPKNKSMKKKEEKSIIKSAATTAHSDALKKKKKKKTLPRVVKQFEEWLSRLSNAGQRGWTEKEGAHEYGDVYHDRLCQYVEKGWVEQRGSSKVWWISDEGKAALAGS